MEEWRDIKEFEGLYQVSNYGRIKSLKRILIDGRIWYERIMKTPLSAGYPSISLRKDNTYFKERVHRVVGKTFIEGYQENYCINHINGIKTDNHISNLEWCTYSENLKHARDTGLNNILIKLKEINMKPTVQLSLNNEFIKIFNSAREASEFVKCPIQNITRVCRGERKSARGFIWKYLKNYEN